MLPQSRWRCTGAQTRSHASALAGSAEIPLPEPSFLALYTFKSRVKSCMWSYVLASSTPQQYDRWLLASPYLRDPQRQLGSKDGRIFAIYLSGMSVRFPSALLLVSSSPCLFREH